jgi:hypothetical protein
MKDYHYRGYRIVELLSGGFAIEKDGTAISRWQPTSRAAEEVIETLTRVEPPPDGDDDAIAKACEGLKNRDLTPRQLSARTVVALRGVKRALESPAMAAALGAKVTVDAVVVTTDG